jgi:hypothetical protein
MIGKHISQAPPQYTVARPIPVDSTNLEQIELKGHVNLVPATAGYFGEWGNEAPIPEFDVFSGRPRLKKERKQRKSKNKKKKGKQIQVGLNSCSVDSLVGWKDEPMSPMPLLLLPPPLLDNMALHGAVKQCEAAILFRTDNAEECLESGEVQMPDGWRFWLTRSPGHVSAVRFSGKQLQLAHGLHIVDARLIFRAYSQSAGPVTLRLRAEASDSASEFAKTERFDLSSRSKTASSVIWSPSDWISAGEEYETPDLSPLLNELVQRYGWTEDSSVVIFIETVLDDCANYAGDSGLHEDDAYATHSPRVSVSWEAFHGQQSARLLVNYQSMAPVPPAPPTTPILQEPTICDMREHVEPAEPITPPARTSLVVKPPSISPKNASRLLSFPGPLHTTGIGLEILCLDGTQVKVHVTKETTVRQMKQRVQQHLGRHAALPELWVNSEDSPKLEDRDTLGDCGIVDGSTVYVLEGADTLELLRELLLTTAGLKDLWVDKEDIFDGASDRMDELPGVKSDREGNVLGLNLCNITLEILPDSIGKFATLVDVNLASCKLSVIPDSFCDLTSLQEVIMSGNMLTQLPALFGQLVHLEHLDMRGNSVKTLPKSFSNLSSLEFCNFAGNCLGALPEDFDKLVSLQTLFLHGNQLSALPTSFGALPELSELKLGDWFGTNPIKRFPNSMTDLRALKQLFVENCPLQMCDSERMAFEAELGGCEVHWPQHMRRCELVGS